MTSSSEVNSGPLALNTQFIDLLEDDLRRACCVDSPLGSTER